MLGAPTWDFMGSFKIFMTLSLYLKHVLLLKTQNSIKGGSRCCSSITMPRALSLALDPIPL